MRRRSRKDENEDEIVAALRKMGADVEPIGRPVDLLVGFRGKTLLLEVKNPDNRYNGTDSQKDWIAKWRGQVAVVETIDGAIEVVLGAVEASEDYAQRLLHGGRPRRSAATQRKRNHPQSYEPR